MRKKIINFVSSCLKHEKIHQIKNLFFLLNLFESFATTFQNPLYLVLVCAS